MKITKLRLLLLSVTIGLITQVICYAADGAGAAVADSRSWREKFNDRNVRSYPNGSLKFAVESGDLAVLQKALRFGANPNLLVRSNGNGNVLRVSDGSSLSDTICRMEPILAHMLRYYPRLDITEALLSAGADINHSATCDVSRWAPDPSGNPEATGSLIVIPLPPLHDLFVDIPEINQPIFEALVRRPLTATTANNALMAACRSQHSKIIRQLLDRGAVIDWAADRTRLDIKLVDTLKAQHALVTQNQHGDVYEMIDDLVLYKTDRRIRNRDSRSLLDSAVLANNYKAVDALLLHGFSEQELLTDSVASLIATTAIKRKSVAGSGAIADCTLDKYGNLVLGERKIAEIGNWYDAVTNTSAQAKLPHLRITSLERDLDSVINASEVAILDFAKANLIIKLLQDRDMARTGLAAMAVEGGATGFMAGSIPLRYTAAKSGEILENLRMQRAERDSRAAGLQSIAKPARAAASGSELGFEMMPMRGGRERYAGAGWDEDKDGR